MKKEMETKLETEDRRKNKVKIGMKKGDTKVTDGKEGRDVNRRRSEGKQRRRRNGTRKK